MENLLDRIERRTERLEARLAAVERRLASGAGAPSSKASSSGSGRAPAQSIPPWKMDAPSLQALASEMRAAVKKDAAAALNLEPAAEGSYLSQHARNVSKLAMFLAARHGLSEPTVQAVGLCGLLHDAGMDCLPHDFLWLDRPLTQEEFRTVRMHPARGAEYVRQHYAFGSLLDSVVPAVVEQHHERSDGSGYPRGLAGDRIHDLARILAVADSYEAMVTPRPFRAARHPADAMRLLLLQGWHSPKPALYDRNVLKTFVCASSLYPVGCSVLLGDGRRGRVVEAGPDPRRPVVEILSGEGCGGMVDLARHPGISVAAPPPAVGG